MQTPREYIQELKSECNAELAQGRQIDFYDAMAISRPTGEQAVYWMHKEIRRLRTTNADMLDALQHVADILRRRNQPGWEEGVLETVNAAIAKATGE